MDSLGPAEKCSFEATNDAMRYVGFDPDPPNIQPDGTLYFVVDVVWLFSKGLGQNCLKWVLAGGTSADDPPYEECVLYNNPFIFQVSSYVLVWEPPPQQTPAHWAAGMGMHVPAFPRTAWRGSSSGSSWIRRKWLQVQLERK